MNIKPLLLIFCHLFHADIDRRQSFPPGWTIEITEKSIKATSPEGFSYGIKNPKSHECMTILQAEAWDMEDELAAMSEAEIRVMVLLRRMQR